MIHRRDLSVSGTSGGWLTVSAMVDGKYTEMRYLYYSKQEAISKFLRKVNHNE